ncbi:hypothetical protein SDC9_193165 [bioreactor metagenome]|uniref:Transposon-encoded protein TnpW n=1 Tax=bioreactor metagenome TaxID=1076179 RepID=A0A645I2W8_9ZZZZ
MISAYKQPPPKEDRKIGSTTYTITSYFKDKGCTAVDKIKRLIDIETKNNNIHRKG